jgi:Protein of unknown function (DUF3606)
MSDDVTNRETRDRARIDINQDSERRDWAKRLGVTEDELKDAVRTTGDSEPKVRNYLQVKNFIGRLKDYVMRHRHRSPTR